MSSQLWRLLYLLLITYYLVYVAWTDYYLRDRVDVLN
jgi:hypothetical protein